MNKGLYCSCPPAGGRKESDRWERTTRFQIIYTQGITDITRILLDTRTGVLYLQTVSGYAGGLTPLLDSEGRP